MATWTASSVGLHDGSAVVKKGLNAHRTIEEELGVVVVGRTGEAVMSGPWGHYQAFCRRPWSAPGRTAARRPGRHQP